MSVASIMPQCRNKKEGSKLQLYGKGSTQSVILDVSITTRMRADKLNQIESCKLRTHQAFLDRNARFLEMRQKRAAEKIHKSLEVLNAYHQLVSDEFKVDNFDTLTWGYNPKEAKRDPVRFQRLAYETRIYHSGFSIQNLKREVNRKLHQLKPERQKQQDKEQLMDRMKRSSAVEVFDRRRSLTTLLDDSRRIRRKKEVIVATKADKK